MPRATDHPTPSRRVFIGGATLGLLAGAPIAALAAMPAGPNPDANLIAACAEYHRLHRLWNDEGDAIEDDECALLGAARQAVLDRLAGWDPRTPEGLRAKASVGFGALLWREDTFPSMPWRENASPEDIVAIEALRDISGMQEPVKVLRPAEERIPVDQHPSHRDAELFAACAAFHAAADAERAACGGESDLPPELTGAVDACLDAVDELMPSTIEGTRAKAGVLHRLLFARVTFPDTEELREGVSRLDVAALNFLHDLAGEARA